LVHYGNDEGGRWLADFGTGREYSDRTAEMIDIEVKALMDEAYQNVKQILLNHKRPMEDLKDALIKYETLDGDEVKQILEGKPLTKPTVGDLLEAERRKEKLYENEKKATSDPDAETDFSGPIPHPELG
ncbi:MAG: hypothetical protein JW709_14185, partial [Sedimentisphaerales bacterium]|nr:hypothetical protein [Sedimentisphaerales bacterium]